MDILCAIHHYPPRYGAGAEFHLQRLAQGFAARGHRVRVLCVERVDGTDPGVEAAPSADDGGVRVRRLAVDGARSLWPYRLAAHNPHLGREVRNWLADERPDVFWLYGGYLMSAAGLTAAADAGIPAIVTISDFWFVCPRITLMRSDGTRCQWPVPAADCVRCVGEEQRRYRWAARMAPALMAAAWRRRRAAADRIELRRQALREALRRADAVTMPSQFAHRLFAAEGIAADRLHLIHPGCTQPTQVPEPRARSAGGPLRVGYLGQIARHKGVHVLLEAARRIPAAPLRVEIHGDPDAAPPNYRSRLRRLLAGDERLQLHGPYRHADLGAVLGGLDVVVVPSVWYENSPNVVLEALAHRRPVIASDIGATAELVRDGHNGVRVPAGDAGALAACLERLAADPTILERWRAGIEPVRSLAAEVDDFERLLQRVAADGGRGASTATQ
jgi:glycosyltransferase involved in cell wall biosynthesis